MDYIDIVNIGITILGILTTILLGWNIYTLIDFKTKMNELEKIKRDFSKIFEINRATYIKHVLNWKNQ